ncbi:MAG: GNAT family N-acetyltransferase [Anaerolineae bacterium]|jgi:GNAT superfamily N-acetyltransferase
MITEYALTKAHRIRLARAFSDGPRVDLSIDCAIEGQRGRALVDDLEEPTAFRIEVGPFFYLAGDATGPGGRAMLKDIAPYKLLMPSSPGWLEAAKKAYGERLIRFPRYSFSAEHLSAEHLDHLCRASLFREDVRRMDVPFVAQIWGRDHLVELADFDSAEDFLQRGIGFYLEREDTLVAAAYSSLVCSRGIEVSIFVLEDYRRQGIATILAGRLLGWCLENNAWPNWDAANLESCRLAEKLGYTKIGQYEAHYLVAR